MPEMKRFLSRSMMATWLSGVLVLSGVVSAVAATQSPEVPQPEDRPELAQENWEGAVSATDPERAIIRFDMDRFIEQLGDQESEEEDVIVLEADILFAPNSWELPETAAAKLEEIVEDVPEGSTVSITGHTDSRPVPEAHDFDNQELSERRAQAVAEALEAERPDFDITAEGRGDAEPAVTEDPEAPGTYAANRRVEIRHGD